MSYLAVSDPYVQKQNSRRNIPPHVPPRNDVAPVVIPTIPNTNVNEHRINEHIKEQKENIKPASDPWKATPEQKKFYSDEFEKLPKVQGIGLRVDPPNRKILKP